MIPFFFDSPELTGYIITPGDLTVLRRMVPGADSCLSGGTNELGHARFGTREDCTGETTLGAWLEANDAAAASAFPEWVIDEIRGRGLPGAEDQIVRVGWRLAQVGSEDGEWALFIWEGLLYVAMLPLEREGADPDVVAYYTVTDGSIDWRRP